MYSILIVCLIAVNFAAAGDEPLNWALIVAGSNEYYNYRHQADVCHAYQILHKNGIPDERIVVMMYDDIANNAENPNKGEIINKPNGPNVYPGVVKDYTKDAVTPGNFLKVLQGKPVNVGSKKVIKSGPNDNVFVYFSDHGAPGLVAFPDGSVLHASELNKAIKSMHTNNQYKNLVLYIESCESGSMFDKLLPENINVYATTAANPDESSYACYYDDERDTYLGDLYSVSWLEDSESRDISKELLSQQYKIVKKETNESHVMQYGNLSMANDFYVSQFQSEKNASNFTPITNMIKINRNFGAVKTEDVRKSILQKKLVKETDPAKIQIINDRITEADRLKSVAESTIREIASIVIKNPISLKGFVSIRSPLTNHECYVPVVDRLLEKCFSAKNEYVLRNLYVLVNLCESGIQSERIIKTIDLVCKQRLE